MGIGTLPFARENESLRLQQWNDRNPVGPFIRRRLEDPFARRHHADLLAV